jgi:hypothetical protein
MKSDEEIKGDVERSNAPFEDTRSLAEKKKYDAIQKDKRQRRADRLQYERYKHRLGSENVPKSFSGFRRMKISGSKNWGVMEAQYKGMGYYNKALANEPQITNTVKDIADTVDMKPSGLEFRIKGKDSYLRKIRSEYSERGNNFEIKDILRYTYVDDAKTMSDKTLNSIEEYGKLGYNTVEIKNYWLKPDIAYNGVNTVISSPDGQKFELQYHTPHSFDIKNGKMHKLYEEYRLLEDRNCEYAVNLRDEMNRLNKGLVPPKDIDKVK